jgi:hypothetical protein
MAQQADALLFEAGGFVSKIRRGSYWVRVAQGDSSLLLPCVTQSNDRLIVIMH